MHRKRCAPFRLELLSLLLSSGVLMAGEGLDRAEAKAALDAAWQERKTQLAAERAGEMAEKAITIEGRTLRWEQRVFGEAPADGRSLWISMHGGGGAPARVNDGQWRNQVRLYEPEEGIYVAPRAPTDTWNLWHEAHIDQMFDRLIASYVALRGVNPERVFLMGYSAGGDGVWQLAPRMADRWAAAAMMAGHPNDAALLPLRNLPIALFVGENDAAYRRNEVVAERAAQLAALAKVDPGGYSHLVRIYPGLPHWMDRRDAEALPWMAKHTRQAWPKKVVWVQDDVKHARFYWLAVDPAAAKQGTRITAEVRGQTIELQGDLPRGLTLRLSDELLDLDQPVQVLVNGAQLFQGKVERLRVVIEESLRERADPRTAATAKIALTLPASS